MVAKTLLDLFKRFKVTDYNGLEDIGDKFSFQLSVIVFMICSTIVTSKTYILKPMACYTPVTPSGSNFDGYLRNYCWVTGTIPQNDEQKSIPWDESEKINYYQWVPFVLGLQCIMFYIPRLFWQLLSYNKMGINLELIFSEAKDASNDNEDKRKKTAKNIAKNLAKVFHFHRDYKYTTWANFRRKVFRLVSFFMVSQRLGTWMTFWYFIIKCMFLANSIGQLFLIHRFLGFEGNNIFKTSSILFSTILNGLEWKQSNIFPRRSFCPIKNIKLLGAENDYMSQCVLSMNMINEKVYMFLWVWLHIVAIATCISLFLWIKKMAFNVSRVQFIKKYMKNQGIYKKNKREQLDNFAQNFVRHDGTLILNMMSINCGDLITTAVICELWELYQVEYASSDASSSEKDPHLLYRNVDEDYLEKLEMKSNMFI